MSLFILTINLYFLSSAKQVQAATSFDDQVINLINIERGKEDLVSLKKSDKLTQAATSHNISMNDCYTKYNVSSCFAHQVTQLNEDKLIDRISSTGYDPQSVAENIARGFTTPASTVTAWMNSSGHRAAILNTSRPDIGCDFLDGANGNSNRYFWTCDFGNSFSISDSYPLPTNIPNNEPSPTPTPIESGPTKIPNLTPTKNITPTPTLKITPIPINQKPWFCKYIPNSRYCQ